MSRASGSIPKCRCWTVHLTRKSDRERKTQDTIRLQDDFLGKAPFSGEVLHLPFNSWQPCCYPTLLALHHSICNVSFRSLKEPIEGSMPDTLASFTSKLVLGGRSSAHKRDMACHVEHVLGRYEVESDRLTKLCATTQAPRE
jgi:hypothetical protein